MWCVYMEDGGQDHVGTAAAAVETVIIEFAIKIQILTDITLNRKYFIYNFARSVIRSV